MREDTNIGVARTAPYRKNEPRATDLETAAIHDLVKRIKQHRRRVALPVAILAMLMAWVGAAAHALGYWSVLGAMSDGSYLVSTATMVIAGSLGAAPVLAPGIALYVALRARLRREWRAEHRHELVAEEWLESTSRRFG